MDKRKWPWKKKSSERSPGETDSSGSFSSHSERYSDEQEVLRESPNDSSQSPEVTSKGTSMDDETKETMKSLTEKLSAALVNVSAKEDLVKQHAKVAEEAVAGWEKAENEVTAIKQQLESALHQNVNLEVRASHLDGALKECVRQLRQSKDEQEKRIAEWESEKADLEKRILDLRAEAEKKKSDSIDPDTTLLIVESLERENSYLKRELASLFKDLEIITIERDLSTRAAENASKSQLESIKKIAKLESECRRLQSVARKSTTPLNNHKSFSGFSSFQAESLTDSCKSSSYTGSEQNYSELDQIKNEKNLSVEIDMMDDFLEMERLLASSETEEKTPISVESGFADNNILRAEIDSMSRRVDELESELKKIEAEKLQLRNALDGSLDNLKAANETKDSLEFQLVSMEVEARTLSENVESLKAEIEEERKLSEGLSVKCQELENELNRKIQETKLEESIKFNAEPKIKQEDLAVAADKLLECQKTIASLGRQLESLATLEDFLIDTSNIPTGDDVWTRRRVPSQNTSLTRCDSDRSRTSMGLECLANGDEDTLHPSLADHVTGGKNRNGFGKFFARSKSVVELGNNQD